MFVATVLCRYDEMLTCFTKGVLLGTMNGWYCK